MPNLQLDRIFLFLNYTAPNLDSRIFELHDLLARQFLSCLFILFLIAIIPYAIFKLPRFRAVYIILLSLNCIHSILADLLTSKVFHQKTKDQTNLEIHTAGINFLLNRNHVQFYIRVFTPFYHWTAIFVLTLVYLFFVDTRKPQSDRINMFQQIGKIRNLLLISTFPIMILLSSILVCLSYNFYIATLFGQIITACVLLLLVRRSSDKWSKHFHRYQTTEYKKAKNRIATTLNVYFCLAMAVLTLFLTPIPETAFTYWFGYELAQWFTPLLQVTILWLYVFSYSRMHLPPLIKPLKAQGDPGIPLTDLKSIFSSPSPNADRVMTFLELREQMSTAWNSTEPGNKPSEGNKKF